MVLKNRYNFNKITKNKAYLELLTASKNSFFSSQNLLKSQNLSLNLKPLNLKYFFNTKSKPTFQGYQNSIKTQLINQSGINFVNELVYNWSCFVYTKRMVNYKKIQTEFRTIISDQKKRAAFDNHELTRMLLKSLLCVHKTSLLNPNPKPNPPLVLQKDKITTNSQKSKILNKDRPYIGSGLLLEQSIYRQFTKKQAISKLRNRCILTGRASIIGKYPLSRITFRRYAGKGLIPGLVKRNN
uniref:Ribosomal protein S14 n=1 Tax=Percursaria percursa TaxID=153906 RepID=A0A8K1JAT6_9CHLO|nr:ribosomal protein S14 [Percursaria percursa]